MGTLPSKFSATTPDTTLEAVAKTGKYGSGGLAKLAHVNKLIDALTLPAYPDDAGAVAALLVAGDLYQTDGTAAAPLNAAGIVMVVQ